jgi:hypothetical protein
MSEQGRRILEQAMNLSPTERAEHRLDAYERGKLKSSPADEVFARIDRGDI